MRRMNVILLTGLLTITLLVVEIIIVRNVSSYEPRLSVCYTKDRIPERTVITEDMIEKRNVAYSMAHGQSVRAPQEIIGKVAGVDFEAGEMILSSRLHETGVMGELKVTDRNNRLFTVEFRGDQANGWWLGEGQYVDIIFVPVERPGAREPGEADYPEQSDKAYGEFILDYISGVKRLKNIRIAALIDEKGRVLKDMERNTIPKFISFEVTEKQDEFLAYAKTNGRLEISVIPDNDN